MEKNLGKNERYFGALRLEREEIDERRIMGQQNTTGKRVVEIRRAMRPQGGIKVGKKTGRKKLTGKNAS